MIEVTKKNKKGTIEIVAIYETDKAFANKYWPSDIPDLFATSPIQCGTEDVYLPALNEHIRVPCFMHVAYNEKGKILDPTHLIGIVRRHNDCYNRPSSWWRVPGTKNNWHRGTSYKQIHTTPERRASFACEDQEECAPKIRCKRNCTNLPNTWDDYRRFNEKNWKKFRNHQWKTVSL